MDGNSTQNTESRDYRGVVNNVFVKSSDATDPES